MSKQAELNVRQRADDIEASRRVDVSDAEIASLRVAAAELAESSRATLERVVDDNELLRAELGHKNERIAVLERLADEDALAPILNRRALLRELARTISYNVRYGTVSSLLYFDLNGMKSINDIHGHAAGDAALIHISSILASNIRASDMVGRLGGDEFGVILHRADNEAANYKAESLAVIVRSAPFEWRQTSFELSVAHGTCSFADSEDAEAILAAADEDMYRRKRDMKREL